MCSTLYYSSGRRRVGLYSVYCGTCSILFLKFLSASSLNLWFLPPPVQLLRRIRYLTSKMTHSLLPFPLKTHTEQWALLVPSSRETHPWEEGQCLAYIGSYIQTHTTSSIPYFINSSFQLGTTHLAMAEHRHKVAGKKRAGLHVFCVWCLCASLLPRHARPLDPICHFIFNLPSSLLNFQCASDQKKAYLLTALHQL